MQAGAIVGVRSRCQSKLAVTVAPSSAPNRYTLPWLVTIGTPADSMIVFCRPTLRATVTVTVTVTYLRTFPSDYNDLL